jgi:hypothetical protein
LRAALYSAFRKCVDGSFMPIVSETWRMRQISRGSDSFHVSAVTLQDVCSNLNNKAIPRLVRSKTHLRSGWEIC